MRHRLAPRGLAALAVSSTLLLSACFAQSPNQSALSDDIKQLSHAKTIAVGEGPHGITYAGGMIVNSNPKSGDISIIDPATDAVAKTLTFDGGKDSNSPTQAQATKDGKYAITMDSKAHVLRVIKGETQAVVGTVVLGKAPGSKIVWADATTAYVALGAKTGETTVEPTENVAKVTWTNGFEAEATVEKLTINREGTSAFVAGFLAVGGGYLAVPNANDNSVSFVKIGETAVTTLQEGNAPGPIGISTLNGSAILVYGNKNSNTVVVYDLNAKQVLGKFEVGSTPTDLVIRADGKYAYITCAGAGEIAIVDLGAAKLHSKIAVGRGTSTASKPVHIYLVDKPAAAAGFRVAHEGHDHEPAPQQVWVGGDGDGSVTVLDAETQKAIAVIAVGNGHHKMAFTTTKAYVSNITDNTVSVIDRSVIQ
jgi:DNA-binding beta-propeller fold protein YncE